MFHTKTRSIVITVLLLGLLLSLFQVPAQAETDKIHPQVREAMAGRDFIQILIKLNLQPDPQEAARAALRQLPPDTQPETRKLAAGEAVLDTLQSIAASSQQPLLCLLETATQIGLARGIKSFCIVNVIYAEVHPSLVSSLARRRDVAAILPNTPIGKAGGVETITGAPTDKKWNLEDIGVFAAHNSGINGSGVVVGIIDTGVDWHHPDLERRWRGYNSAGPAKPDLNWYDAVSGLSMPYDDDGHGTHIAGIIAGENGTGVAPGATWIAAKAFDEFGVAKPAWLLSAGEYMLAPLDASGNPCPDMAPDIINNSWGIDSGFDEWYRPMVQAWRAAGILPIFAAGNDAGRGSIFIPANYPEVLAVAAVNPEKRRSIFSGEGPAPYSEICKPDLAAPGEKVYSTRAGGGYSLMSGTSVAAPHVTGTAALLLSRDPELTPEILEAVLKQTALPLTDSQYPDVPNWGYGYGLVQADAALALVREPAGIIQGKVSTSAEETQGDGNSSALPLEAVVTIEETGVNVRTGYADGIFSGSFVLVHSLNQTEIPTLRVTARGYKPLVKKINIAARDRINLDLSLEPLNFSFQRLSGDNRYATAAAISQKGWEKAETVFLARGDNYADALAGVPLAYAFNAPVLLTDSHSLPDWTCQELLRLRAKKVVILGGCSAIDSSVETAINQELSIETERVCGANRFATAAEIARRLSKLSYFDTAIIAYGNNFPDALSAAPFAAAQGIPILLTRTGQLPEETNQALEDLGIAKTIVTGGINAVGAAVFNQLPLPLRLEGPSRYYTAVALAEHFQPQSNKLYLATGADFADAISGAALAARGNAALLLLSDVVPYPVTEFILNHGTEKILFLGGNAVIPETIPEAIKMLEP